MIQNRKMIEKNKVLIPQFDHVWEEMSFDHKVQFANEATGTVVTPA